MRNPVEVTFGMGGAGGRDLPPVEAPQGAGHLLTAEAVTPGITGTGFRREMASGPTPSQTVGPYFHIGLAWRFGGQPAPRGVAGERIEIAGRVLDGDGKPVPDAMIETWQADAEGRYPHPEDPRSGEVDPRFCGFGRWPTDSAGGFRISTVKPGRVAGPDGRLQAPHLVCFVFMRGLLRHLVTRIYLPDDPANREDPVLSLVEPARRATLVARRGASPGTFSWDVVMQGEAETVFFDC